VLSYGLQYWPCEALSAERVCTDGKPEELLDFHGIEKIKRGDFRSNAPWKVRDFLDGTSNTIMVSEVRAGRDDVGDPMSDGRGL